MHRNGIRIMLGLSALLAVGAVVADDVFEWKDARGVTHYTQTPPPAGTAYKAHAESTSDKAANAVQTASASPIESPQCATARKNLELLRGEGALQQDTDGDGKPDRTLSDTDRANQMELAQATLKASCAVPALTPGR